MFAWPLALLLLLLVPALVAAYFLQKRRKKRGALRYSSVALIRVAMTKRPSWRRRLPMALFLGGVASLGVASARPQASVLVPFGKTSIILAMDVSRSMCATDVPPNRLAVAQEAARSFVRSQPSGTRIGLVVFAGYAELVVPPTTERDELIAAIDRLTTARGTAIGSATLKAIDAIAGVNSDVAPIGSAGGDTSDGTGPSAATAPDTTTTPGQPPVEGYVPDIVVLLTDGANTRGIDPIEAAKEATARRIRVYTIGFGTENPADVVCSAAQLGSDAFGDGGGFGGGGPGGGPPSGSRRRFLVIDEPTLRAVADNTGGNFYRAEDAGQLNKVFKELPKQVELQRQNLEVSVGFAALGVLLAGAAMVLSLLWNRSP